MFEFLFKYPAGVFSKGTFVLLGTWPRWALGLSIAAAVLAIGAILWKRRSRVASSVRGLRLAAIWGLQSALLAILLLLLWEPAISVTALRPQQNIIAVVVDDSRSMALNDVGRTREEMATHLLNSGLLRNLSSRFQVRLYRLDAGVQRIADTAQLKPDQTSTQIGKGLRQLADEAATLPIGAVVLMTDGADNSGGIDLDTVAELRRRRLPVNTVGIGREQLANDVELDGLDLPVKALTGSRLQAQVALRQNGFSGKHAKLLLTADGNILASRDVALNDAPEQVETLEFNAGKAGVKNVRARLEPLPGESNTLNNELTQALSVDDAKRRILYVE